jgi:hypothetical protein
MAGNQHLKRCGLETATDLSRIYIRARAISHVLLENMQGISTERHLEGPVYFLLVHLLDVKFTPYLGTGIA